MSINLKPLSTAISFLYHQSKDLDKLTLFLNLNGFGHFQGKPPKSRDQIGPEEIDTKKKHPFPH